MPFICVLERCLFLCTVSKEKSFSFGRGESQATAAWDVRERLSNNHYLALSVSADEVGGKGEC